MGMSILKNMVQVVNLAPGVPTTYAHGLQDTDGRALLPDHVYAPTNGDLQVINADATNITVINNGFAQASGSILIESWHTENRSFPGTALTLAGLPYISGVVAGGGTAERIDIGAQTVPTTFTQRIIYANAGGSDVVGDGSVGNPYRTFLRAIQDVPLNIKLGESWVLDLTGLGVENLAGVYRLPHFIGSQSTTAFDFGAPSYIETMYSDIVIRATPTDVLNIPAGNITGQVADPTTGHITVQTNLALVPGAHVGQIIQGAGVFEAHIVVSNTATDLETTATAAFTPDIVLQTQSATLRNSDGASTSPVMDVSGLNANLGLGGIAFDHANAGSNVSLAFERNTGEVFMLSCSVAGLRSNDAFLRTNTNYITRALNVSSVAVLAFADFYDTVNNDSTYAIDAYGENQFINCIWEAPSTPIHRHTGDGATMAHLQMDSCIVRNAAGFGVEIHKCYADIIDCLIEGSGAAGIFVTEQGFLYLEACDGLLNTTLGCQINDGAQVNVSGVLGLTGAAGDYQCGDNAAAAGAGAGWAALTNETDIGAVAPELCRAYR